MPERQSHARVACARTTARLSVHRRGEDFRQARSVTVTAAHEWLVRARLERARTKACPSARHRGESGRREPNVAVAPQADATTTATYLLARRHFSTVRTVQRCLMLLLLPPTLLLLLLLLLRHPPLLSLATSSDGAHVLFPALARISAPRPPRAPPHP